MVKFIFLFVGIILFNGCSLDIDTASIIKKYKEDPRRDGSLREEIIEQDILPEFHKETPHQLQAIRFAKKCYRRAQDVKMANSCRKETVQRFGDEFDFNEYKVWDESMKQKVMNFLNDQEVFILCYDRAKKAKDILSCPDPKEPNF